MRYAFDPFTATIEEAQCLQELSGQTVQPDTPILQWVEAQHIKADRARIEAGTGFDVLAAVAGCATRGLVMPDWLARAFLKRYRQVQQLRVASWDAEDAFGKPYPSKAQLGAMRRRRDQRFKVWEVVTDFVQRYPDAPMDPLWHAFGSKLSELATVPADFAERARRVGCGRSSAQERYREACDLYGLHDDRAIRARLAGLPATSAKVAGRRKKA